MSSRILVAGSQPVLRDAIRALLEQGGFCVVGVASNADDAVEMARRSHPDVTVLDASTPGPNAVEIVRRIQGAWAQTRVLLLDGKGDDLRNAEHFAEGIAGLVGKNDAPGDFIQAVAEVSTLRLQPDSRWRPTAPCRRRKLSRRQREVLAMMSDSLLDPSILVTHIGGLDAAGETTLNLPKIPGAKKLIYTGISMPLTAISDFEEKGKSDPFFAKLHELTAATNGLWNAQAEKYLLANAKSI
jgi:DNA-binding NarL/FixJ family response regulator